MRFKIADANAPTLKIYPNPAGDFLNIDIDTQIEYSDIQAMVFDVTGKQVSNFALTNGINTIDIGNFPNGIYFFRLLIDGNFENKKVIVQH